MNEREVAQQLLKLARALSAGVSKEEVDELAAAFKKMRGVSKVVIDEVGGGGASMTLTADGEPIEITVKPNGKVTWDDFTHSTPLGKASEPKRVVKGLLDAFKKMDEDPKSITGNELFAAKPGVWSRHKKDAIEAHKRLKAALKDIQAALGRHSIQRSGLDGLDKLSQGSKLMEKFFEESND